MGRIPQKRAPIDPYNLLQAAACYAIVNLRGKDGVNQDRMSTAVALVLTALNEFPSDTGVLNPTLLALKALTQKHGE